MENIRLLPHLANQYAIHLPEPTIVLLLTIENYAGIEIQPGNHVVFMTDAEVADLRELGDLREAREEIERLRGENRGLRRENRQWRRHWPECQRRHEVFMEYVGRQQRFLEGLRREREEEGRKREERSRGGRMGRVAERIVGLLNPM